MNSIDRNAPTARPRSSSRRVLLLGLDGVRWDIAREAGENLARLAQEGTFATMEMEVPTISGPGWGSILTGATHKQHGVLDNSMVGSRLIQYPDFLSHAFYRDTTRTTFAAAAWPVLVDPAGLGPIVFTRMEQQYAGLHNVIVRDGETYGYVRMDGEIADVAVAKLNSDAFDAGFVYFCTVDDAGHVYGLTGPEYPAAVKFVDGHVGRIIEAVTRRYTELSEDWLVVITTDHGHRDEGGHGGDTPEERASWVIAWSPDGYQVEWGDQLKPYDLMELMLAEL